MEKMNTSEAPDVMSTAEASSAMDAMDAMRVRHSVRSYTDQCIEEPLRERLQAVIDVCNKEGGLHIQAVYDEPQAFSGMMARYGQFSQVNNYLALVGEKAPDLDERVGYYGERVVLAAQQLGLNTCWVALTFSKGKTQAQVNEGEKLVCVIALGYGSTQGKARKSKTAGMVSRTNGEAPAWFTQGVEAALLAPTAMNQQKFFFALESHGNDSARVMATAKSGPYAKLDLGIAKLHFELGAGRENFTWA